ncbi:TPA: hypothetical protein QCU37_004600 [Bacillus cereus]|nr:hypothetical protein [Bacillus cereus]
MRKVARLFVFVVLSLFVLLAKSILLTASLLELITKSKEDHNERNVNHLIDCASKEVKANCIAKKKCIQK